MELKVNNLSCKRGELSVLSNVSFTVGAGQSLILRGPNGIGKSTLIRALLRLAPSTGNISQPVDMMAYAGHADGIKSQLTVFENLRFWADVYGTKDITPAVDAFNLMPLLTRPAQALSAGQKRRLGLSRLLTTGRKIWVLDEPTVSLDTDSVATFAKLVNTHTQSGGITIIATHIELGIQADVLDLTPFRAKPELERNPFLDEAIT